MSKTTAGNVAERRMRVRGQSKEIKSIACDIFGTSASFIRPVTFDANMDALVARLEEALKDLRAVRE